MDIATKFASSQEAVEAIFRKDKQPQGHPPEDAPEASTQCGAKKKGKKKSQAKRDAADADLVAAAEYKNPRKPPGGTNLFDKMLKESCPYHQGPVKHTLKECAMLRRHFHRAGPPVEGGRARDDDKKEDHHAGGRRDWNCGSRTTGWLASWVERTMTTSSSATSPCSSPTPLAPGWSTCLRGRSPTETTWSKPSPAISRARTCALETPGTSEAADSSRESLSETTSDDSRSSAPSCPTSPIQMSSARSSPAPPAATW
jgi:hypothetical protein